MVHGVHVSSSRYYVVFDFASFRTYAPKLSLVASAVASSLQPPRFSQIYWRTTSDRFSLELVRAQPGAIIIMSPGMRDG